MEYAIIIVLIIFLAIAITMRRCVIFEYQRGLLYSGGKFVRVLQPGVNWYFRPTQSYFKVDVRTQNVTIPGQDVLSSDTVSIKISLAASYKVADPYLVLNQVANYQEALYLLLQLNLRDVVGSLPIDDLLARREEIGRSLFEKSAAKAAEIGIELFMVNIKDIMFPGELKAMFAQVVNARKEGLAALERARGESAALRNLANAAKLLDGNPNLLQLRLFRVLEANSGNTIVMMPPEGMAGLKGIGREIKVKPDFLAVICDPITGDALEIETRPDANDRLQEFLVNPKTGQRYPVREDIPIFLEGATTGSNKRYQSLYDRIAPFYDLSTWLYSRWKGMSVEVRLREYLDELEVRAGSKVLEISVGTGRNLQFLPRTAQFFGLDISWGMLKQCQRNTAKWKLEARLCMGTAEHLPFKDEAFDVVFHFGGINFFNDKAAAIREMIRVARPGTKFVIGDENEAFAQKYEKLPGTGDFYGERKEAITAPVELLPPEMQDVKVKNIAGGDLYCLSFRKPR